MLGINLKKLITLMLLLLIVAGSYIMFTASSENWQGRNVAFDKSADNSRSDQPTISHNDSKLSSDTQVNPSQPVPHAHDHTHDVAEIADKISPEVKEALKEMIDTSSEGLVEEPAVSGVQVNLQGRFREAPVAVMGENGSTSVIYINSATNNKTDDQ